MHIIYILHAMLITRVHRRYLSFEIIRCDVTRHDFLSKMAHAVGPTSRTPAVQKPGVTYPAYALPPPPPPPPPPRPSLPDDYESNYLTFFI